LKNRIIALFSFAILFSSLVPVFAASENGPYRVNLSIGYELWAYPNEEVDIWVDFSQEPIPPPPPTPTPTPFPTPAPTPSPTPSPIPTPPPLSPGKFAGIPLRFEMVDENGVLVPINPPIPKDCKTDQYGFFETTIRAPEEEGNYTLTVFATFEGEEYTDSEVLPVSTKERPTLPTPIPTPGPVPTPSPTPRPSSTPVFEAVPLWVWVIAAVLIIVIIGSAGYALLKKKQVKRLKLKIITLAIAIVVVLGGVFFYAWFTPPTPTPTPTPVQMISLEEAVEFALKGGEVKWEFTEYRWLGEFEGEPLVTPDGLLEGRLEWRVSNGTLYEAEYPSGKVRGEVERFTGVEDTEEYYVWSIILMDGSSRHIDARNGQLLSFFPSRVPGILTFQTAARIVYAPQKRVEEWRVQEYKRIGDFESEPFETPDGLVKGHLLWRVSNGTLYEVQPPFILDTIGRVLYIEAPDDNEEYNVWEITTENNIYYIDARNGIIRLISGLPTASPYLTKFRQEPELFRSYTRITYVLFKGENGKVLGNLTGILQFTRVDYTVHATLNYSLKADPSISNMTFESGIVWLITQGATPVPMPYPLGNAYTLRDGESVAVEMQRSNDFEPDWEWAQFSAIAIVYNFEVGFVDDHVWKRDETVYLLNTGEDLFRFLHNNPIETETLTFIIYR